MILSPILVLDPKKVERDLAFVMGCLSEVLDEAQEHGLARQLPWRTADAAARTIRCRPNGCRARTRSRFTC